jgi:hypothetical protein
MITNESHFLSYTYIQVFTPNRILTLGLGGKERNKLTKYI